MIVYYARWKMLQSCLRESTAGVRLCVRKWVATAGEAGTLFLSEFGRGHDRRVSVVPPSVRPTTLRWLRFGARKSAPAALGALGALGGRRPNVPP